MHSREPRLDRWPLERCIPNARNAKHHSIDQVDRLASLILKVGFLRPIVVDEAGVILAGHGAHMAASKLGLETVPVSIVSHLTAPEKRAYMLADNRLAEESTWNKALVAEELSALELDKFDFTMTGFSDGDLERMLDELAGGSNPDRSATKPEKGSRMSTPKDQAAAATAAANPNAPAAASTAAAQPSAKTAQPSATVASESDARIVNSTGADGNAMRHAYRVLTEEEKKLMVEVKDLGLALYNKIHSIEAAGSRELSIAKTKCQEAVMWTVSHITK